MEISNHSSNSTIHDFFKLVFDHSTPKGPHLRTQIWVIFTMILLVALFFLGRIRNYVHVGLFLRYTTKIVYTLIPILITYIIGLMHNATTFHVLYPVWACALIYAYGGVISMTACNLRDNDNTLPYFWRTLPLLFWTFWMAMVDPLVKSDAINARYGIISTGMIFQILWSVMFSIFLIMAIFNTNETLEAFYLAGKSKGLSRVVGPLVHYMRSGRDKPDEPASIRGYKYVVWGSPRTSHITTIEGGVAVAIEDDITTIKDIWDQIGTNSAIDSVLVEPLSDICLSYAYFRLILRRFADCPLDECTHDRTRLFVRSELLASNTEAQRERVFRVIEVELAFLFDFFYTKSYVCGSYKLRDMQRTLWNVALLLGFGTFGISYLTSLDKVNFKKETTISFHGHKLEVGVTRLVTIVFAALEAWKFLAICFSNRKMVWLLCTSLINSETATCIEKLIINIWSVKDCLCKRYASLMRPWQRRLGQYSFLDSYAQVPMLAKGVFSSLDKLVKRPRVGQYQEYSIRLSTQVKKAIVASLLPHVQEQVLPLSRGTTTILHYGLSNKISEACPSDTTDAQVILVWHIATSMCELYNARRIGDPDYEHFLVATQLSKYCAYLVCFAPELLPEHPHTTECFFNMAVKQAQLTMEGREMHQRYTSLSNMDPRDPNNVGNIFLMGVWLGNQLMTEVTKDGSRGWKVLAEFWAELLLFLALSNRSNVEAHGDYLARGGEFITHLWALLTHAGIVSE